MTPAKPATEMSCANDRLPLLLERQGLLVSDAVPWGLHTRGFSALLGEGIQALRQAGVSLLIDHKLRTWHCHLL